MISLTQSPATSMSDPAQLTAKLKSSIEAQDKIIAQLQTQLKTEQDKSQADKKSDEAGRKPLQDRIIALREALAKLNAQIAALNAEKKDLNNKLHPPPAPPPEPYFPQFEQYRNCDPGHD